ncbi:MAG: SxtJ family membrane protein [Desulfuromonadales bacterium]
MSETKNPRLQEMETLGVLAAFFLVVNILSHRREFVYVSLALLVIALFVKPLARTISRVWLRFAEVLGTFNSKVILSLVFYAFLTPIAFLYRIFTKDSLMLKRQKNATSFYTERNHTYTRTDLDKMW